jgi:hypothetical protein
MKFTSEEQLVDFLLGKTDEHPSLVIDEKTTRVMSVQTINGKDVGTIGKYERDYQDYRSGTKEAAVIFKTTYEADHTRKRHWWSKPISDTRTTTIEAVPVLKASSNKIPRLEIYDVVLAKSLISQIEAYLTALENAEQNHIQTLVDLGLTPYVKDEKKDTSQ